MKMLLGEAIVTLGAINAVLYDKDKERVLPFKIKYRLIRNREALDREVRVYEEERVKLVREYGDVSKDEQGQETINVADPEKLKLFYEKLDEVLKTETPEFELMQFTEKELEPIENIDIDINERSIAAFFKFLVKKE